MTWSQSMMGSRVRTRLGPGIITSVMGKGWLSIKLDVKGVGGKGPDGDVLKARPGDVALINADDGCDEQGEAFSLSADYLRKAVKAAEASKNWCAFALSRCLLLLPLICHICICSKCFALTRQMHVSFLKYQDQVSTEEESAGAQDLGDGHSVRGDGQGLDRHSRLLRRHRQVSTRRRHGH